MVAELLRDLLFQRTSLGGNLGAKSFFVSRFFGCWMLGVTYDLADFYCLKALVLGCFRSVTCLLMFSRISSYHCVVW